MEKQAVNKYLILGILIANAFPLRSQSAIESRDRNVLFIVAKDKLSNIFDPSAYKNLPLKSFFGYDLSGDVTNAIDLMCGQNLGAQYPQVSIINNNGEIIFYSEGYSIGMGETILKNVGK